MSENKYKIVTTYKEYTVYASTESMAVLKAYMISLDEALHFEVLEVWKYNRDWRKYIKVRDKVKMSIELADIV